MRATALLFLLALPAAAQQRSQATSTLLSCHERLLTFAAAADRAAYFATDDQAKFTIIELRRALDDALPLSYNIGARACLPADEDGPIWHQLDANMIAAESDSKSTPLVIERH